MFNRNPKFAEWRKALEMRGVTLRWLWSAKSHPSKKYDDIALVSFIGNGFQPAEATAVLQNYDGEGFGVWLQSRQGDIEKEAELIAGR